MTARGRIAIAALAFHATLLPLPAEAQQDYVPSAVAPVPNGVSLLGRFLALVAMLVALQLAFMGAGMIVQAL